MLAFAIITAFQATPTTPTAVRQLKTLNYEVTIREFCPQDFDCNHVEYQAVSNSGRFITLRGRHIWHECPGTHDPCHPIGYEFKTKKLTYFVSENGELVVYQGAKVLLDEKGKWKDE